MKNISSQQIADAITSKIPRYAVCVKDKHQRRRNKDVLAAICVHCRRGCPLAGKGRET